MKKINVIISMAALLLLSSCGKAKWYSDYDAAKAEAKKTNKDIFLVFSGDDWDDNSAKFKEAVLNTSEFEKEVSKGFVLVNVDFSQNEFAKTQIGEDATEAEKNEAERIEKIYKEKDVLGRMYKVKDWPSMYVCSYEGYVLGTVSLDPDVGLDDKDCARKYVGKVNGAKAGAMDTVLPLIQAVRTTKGIEKAENIDKLVSSAEKIYSDLYRGLVQEFPSLDPEDKLGKIGFYELAETCYKSYDAIREGTDPASPFLETIEKGHLSQEQVQEAWYMAAYSIVNLPDVDNDRVIDYLEKAYAIDPESNGAQQIMKTLDSMKTFIKMKKEAEEEEAEGLMETSSDYPPVEE